MQTTITATELSKNLSDILNRIQYRGEHFVIERNGKAVANLVPPKTPSGITMRGIIARLGDLQLPGDGFADDLEALQADQPKAEYHEWPS